MTLPPPPDALEACVVVPARDEEALVGACIAALAAQRDVERDAVEVILVLDRCTDATATRAREAALAGGVRLHVVDAPADGVGHARRHGMDLACARLFAAGRPHGLIATTDADSEPDPDWLRMQLDAVAAGARAIGGRVELGAAERAALPPAVVARRGAEARARLARVRADAPAGVPAEHHQFSGASLALTAATYAAIGGVLDALAPLRRAGLIDEILVVDAASRDGTAALAAGRGVRVADESSLLPAYGPALGKGDAMWRGVAATTGEVVAFLDTDTEDFTPAFVLGLLGPLLCEPAVAFVKGAFRRPLRVGDVVVPDGGGRVTELVARPYLNLHVPELAPFVQPLAGEVAARRELLESLPFPVGYGVEIALLIDALRAVGLEGLAQVDLGTRQNRHQPLRDLTAMALAVLAAAERRVHGEAAVAAAAPGPLLVPEDGELRLRSVVVDERPPLRALTPAASAPRDRPAAARRA